MHALLVCNWKDVVCMSAFAGKGQGNDITSQSVDHILIHLHLPRKIIKSTNWNATLPVTSLSIHCTFSALSCSSSFLATRSIPSPPPFLLGKQLPRQTDI